MSKFEIIMPKLGESIIEATITKWLKNEGDQVALDDPLVEIATDKVDSEIPSPVEGVLIEKRFKEGDVVAVGTIIATIDMGGETASTPAPAAEKATESTPKPVATAPVNHQPAPQAVIEVPSVQESLSGRFYSPLVKNIAKQENISFSELEKVPGTGKEGRVTKNDILHYLDSRSASVPQAVTAPPVAQPAPALSFSGENQIIEMDRIRQLIANHMVKSVQTSPHVTSFMEADVTRLVLWREKMKDAFLKKENEKLTFTPIFLDAIAKAVRDFPMINVSVDGSKIFLHKNINIGMAVALPNFNLIVPVIKNVDQKSLLGIVKNVNDIANRARINKLVPDEISGGTLSLTNLGSFGTLMGTPIINQPQTAIVAVGSIKKRPVVIETPEGDTIAIRQMMYVSVTYDHRVIDGALGGQFLSKLVYYLENFDLNQGI
jgi:2-oxoglutarate dehydrogenase E2 component (dihydrolipoamide succinyltransferase)